MKRLFQAAIIILSLGLLASCKGEPGLNGRDGVGVISTVLINVPQSAWEYSRIDNNNYFYATVDMPEITNPVYEEGLIKMYRAYDFGSDYSAQTELPYVRHNEEYVEDGGYMVFYTETVDYEFSVGKMTIFYTESDFNYEIDESFIPETMQFRCVIMY